MMLTTQLRRCGTWLALTSCLASGCATFQLPWAAHQHAKATAQNPAVQIICIWEQAEGRDPNGLPCRGFAGQLLFLANRNAAPVEVEGDVRIYLFDNVGSPEEQARPLRQFDFDSEAWKMHLTKSAVGPSYSVFVPYVRRGQSNAQCALRVRLEAKNGPTIFSELSSLPLKGPAAVPETTIISEPTSPEERVQAEVHQTLSKALQGSTTIPLTADGQGLARSTRTAAAGSANGAAAPTAPSEDRLARMEQMMLQMLQERAANQPAVSESSGIQQISHETPAGEPPLRFKLDAYEE